MPKIERIPNFGHLGILFLLAVCGLFCAGLVARAALHWHLFGVSTLSQAANEIHFTLGTEGLFYSSLFWDACWSFPLLWGKGFFAGLQWRGATALRYRGRLIGAAGLCFILALVNGVLLPGPPNTPIDRIFRMPGAAWMLFAFGVTLAPFFEEIAFRGFLLPALSTAFDWMAERAEGAPPHPLDENGHPQWSMPAMIIASIITSVLFALMHGDQTGYSVGPVSAARLRQPRPLLGAPLHPLPCRQRAGSRLLQLLPLLAHVFRNQRLPPPRQHVNDCSSPIHLIFDPAPFPLQFTVMTTPTHAQQLLSILARTSFKLGQFKLSSGGTSDYYIDCRTTTLHAEGGRLTGRSDSRPAQ